METRRSCPFCESTELEIVEVSQPIDRCWYDPSLSCPEECGAYPCHRDNEIGKSARMTEAATFDETMTALLTAPGRCSLGHEWDAKREALYADGLDAEGTVRMTLIMGPRPEGMAMTLGITKCPTCGEETYKSFFDRTIGDRLKSFGQHACRHALK